ncbi:tubulin folding cofactor A [Friedmanniomyces endolithicus]|uniref:Tubulin-specific chaperone A n=1 Tax=Friedmanniomyces endolithicus TaxID=329885 RepID=A0AAN6QNI1_9PEZI|nr:tubulin folding cofactor A [Friedmanniomyces endolithicus]KAK0783762.1 tubulin folding cofactor A [Friedmanniomyces endolithicus]KAK0791158.1 tubulin folding cofactor A [Friedmanniomyces endolithicus]KAK0803277.1 tubulin folding cofactor A [Friedmanniomyces endolithicus]KAK0842426.1 tubulin folding cofactor A [Friedmanniomyces endolithicus]
MAPPSQLAIATSVVNRLVKEEASYHKELEKQQASIAKLEQGGGDENTEYVLKQERRGVEETRAIFPQLRNKLQDALARLEYVLVPDNLNGPGYQTTPEDIAKGQEAVAAALKAIHSQS